MQKKKKWEILHKLKVENGKLKIEEVINLLLENRGIKTDEEKEAFFHSQLETVSVETVGIDKKQLQKAIKRILKAIEEKEQIVVFGDYDVDGITGSAILWETLYALGAIVVPYIPHRIDEGYGLSIKGIDNVTEQITNVKLIITVDNGIVANEAVDFANTKGIDVIISDHHVTSTDSPKAHAIVHTTKLCGAGVAYLLAQEIIHVIPNSFRDLKQDDKKMLKQVQHDNKLPNDHLALVALATVADLVPLHGANRILLTFGLEELRSTKRPGLRALFQEAIIDPTTISTYHIGHMIAPRLNAMGRMEYAMEALRLLCTKDLRRADELARKLGSTNRDRQTVTIETVAEAISRIKNYEVGITNQELKLKKLLFISDETYQQGIIGLVAGRLVEEFYRPAVVVSIGPEFSKASARSVSGFNIIEFIRSASDLLVNAGGHPMAAGFTVETVKLTLLQETLEKKAEEVLKEENLIRSLKIDCEIPLQVITTEFLKQLQPFAPFGMGNPEPVFMSRNVIIDDRRLVGKEGKHVKFRFGMEDRGFKIEGIGFGLAEQTSMLKTGDMVDIVYTIDENTWNGNTNLQLKIRDIQAD